MFVAAADILKDALRYFGVPLALWAGETRLLALALCGVMALLPMLTCLFTAVMDVNSF